MRPEREIRLAAAQQLKQRRRLHVDNAASEQNGDVPVDRRVATSSMMRMTSDPMLSPSLERRHGLLLDSEPHGSPPPKPSRVPCLSDDAKGGGVQPVYHASGSDSGNGSGDSVQSSADAVESSISLKQQCGVVIKNPARSYTPPDAAVEPVLEPSSAFDLDSFATLLLPMKENKPLDASAMQGVKLLLLENGSRVIANHLTKVDLELTHAAGRVCPPGMQLDLGLGVHSGIELCSLPHGHQLRLDLIERYVTHFCNLRLFFVNKLRRVVDFYTNMPNSLFPKGIK